MRRRRQHVLHVKDEDFLFDEGRSFIDTTPSSSRGAVFDTSTIMQSVLGQSAAGATIGLHEPPAGQRGGVPIIRTPKPPIRLRAAPYQAAGTFKA